MSKASKFKSFLNFNLSKPKSPKTSLLAIFRYGDGSTKGKIMVSIGSIETKYWNLKKSCLRSQAENPYQDILGKEMDKIKKIILCTFQDITDETGDYPTDQKLFQAIVKAKYKNLPLPNADRSIPILKTKSLIEYTKCLRDDIKTDVRKKANGQSYAKESYKSFHNLWFKLDKYREYRSMNDILFTDISLEFYYDFRDYVVVVTSGSPNYFGTLIKNLKTTMLDAMELGFHNNEQWKSKRFIKETTKADTIYLNEDQLDVLFNLQLSSSYLQNARDLFLIGCYTGLRFSDFNDIEKLIIEGEFLKVNTRKTTKKVTIPIQDNLRVILNRLDQIHSISNQKINGYLKDICKIAASTEEGKKAGFNEVVSVTKYVQGKPIEFNLPFHGLISSHTARRSFATNMFKIGVPSIIIMAITGHSTERAFLTYIKADDSTMANIMMDILNKNKTLKLVPGGLS